MNKKVLIDKLAKLLAEKMILGENPTNGDVIKTLFSDAEIDYHEKTDLVDRYVTVFPKDCDTCQDYSLDWWNTPYEGGNSDADSD